MPKWYGGSTLNPDELIPPSQQWVIQWQRIERWHRRALEVQKKSRKQEIDLEDIDTVIAFFQNAYHLKDWLLASRPDIGSAIITLFRDSFELKACRDICNGFKHKSIKHPSHDPDFNLFREYDHFEIENLSPVKYRISFAEGNDIRKFDLFELVSSVYQRWEGFLSENSNETAK
jgi:hypothetical protein